MANEEALQQRKFGVAIPLLVSSAGYRFLFHMPGYGQVSVGALGVGGAQWRAQAALGVDLWVTALPAGAPAAGVPAAAAPIYRQYADATGHAPLLRDDALSFWQSRNRYKSAAVVAAVAARYAALDLPVGVLVVDYKNQRADGDFAPNPACYPNVSALSAGVRAALNATTMFSFWPEVLNTSANYGPLLSAGCLANADLGGRAFDATEPACRDLVARNFLLPQYIEQGVSAFWLDETDGAGTAGASGYDTSFGPARAYSQLWVGAWLELFSAPVAARGDAPLLLTRAAWAGGARHGAVLWSSDIWSSFEMLRSQVNLAVHSALSGHPWWTSDVGGYGCGQQPDNDSEYMRELIVRWYEFGLFSPVFRTHGCRAGADPDADVPPCTGVQHSCGGNEVWSFNSTATQALLSALIRFRAGELKPYLAALARNVSADGAPPARPLWWEFPLDAACADVDDQFLLGAQLLVAPVTLRGAANRSVVFPAGANWRSVWDAAVVVAGGATRVVDAPLGRTPAWWRV